MCGIAESMGWLIAWRAVQGIGAGGLAVTATALIADVIPLRERGKYQRAIGAVFGVSTLVGPLLGGLFTDHLSWRWAFDVNLPIGIVVGSLVSFVIFVVVESRAADPILPLRLFKGSVFSVSVVLAFIVGFAMLGAMTFLPTYLQYVKGVSATASGVQMLPMVIGLLGTSIAAVTIVGRTGRYKIFPIAGSLLMALGLFLASLLGPDTTFLAQGGAMLVLGLCMQVLTIIVQNTAEYRDLDVATSGVTFFRTLGSSFGASVFGTIYANTLSTVLPGAIARAAPIRPRSPPRPQSSCTGCPSTRQNRSSRRTRTPSTSSSSDRCPSR